MRKTPEAGDSAQTQRRLSLKATLAFLVSLVAAYVVAIFDPLGWGTVESDRFSWERFALVQPGETIEMVIASLGEPVREPEPLEILDTGEISRRDPCFPDRCRTFRFHGARWSRWPASYSEAIVVVGPNDRVVSRIRREE